MHLRYRKISKPRQYIVFPMSIAKLVIMNSGSEKKPAYLDDLIHNVKRRN